MSIPELSHIFFEHDSNAVDKWEHYLAIYEAELGPIVAKGQPVRLLEIGVQNGGSLEIWSKYLPAGSTIEGIDIDPRVSEIDFSRKNISVSVIDASDAESLSNFVKDKTYHIIIDDGSHRSPDIIKSFRKCFPILMPGGLYIIEDFHAAYLTALDGGIASASSAVHWLREMIDAIHYDYVLDDPTNGMADDVLLRKLNRSVARLAVYDSVVVVEKTVRPKLDRFRRIRSGRTGVVVNSRDFVSQIPRAQLGSLRVGAATSEELDRALLELIDRLDHDLALARSAAATERAGTAGELDQRRATQRLLEDNVAALHRELEEARVAASATLAGMTQKLDEQNALAQSLREEVASLRRDLDEARATAVAELAQSGLLRQDDQHLSTQLHRRTDAEKAELLDQLQRARMTEDVQNARLVALELDLVSARETIVQQRAELDQSRRLTEEFMGKLQRSYQAWSLKGQELDRLKRHAHASPSSLPYPLES